MIVMALLVHIPRRAVALLALAMIFGHNLLDPIRPASLGAFAGLWQFLHVPGFVIPNVLFIAYPLVPWVAVMAAGYLLAEVYRWEPERRRRTLLLCGVAGIVLFVVLRWINAYGNPIPWRPQRTPARTLASFLNVLKSPPSLDFLLMTLGPALVALAVAERARGRVFEWLSVYGRVPLFFYVAHIFVAHAVAVLLASGKAANRDASPSSPIRDPFRTGMVFRSPACTWCGPWSSRCSTIHACRWAA